MIAWLDDEGRLAMGRGKRQTHHHLPHDIYVYADPRTGEIRYVGRTVRGVAFRSQQHKQATATSRRPVHHWLRRLRHLGLEPIILVVAESVVETYEVDLCEALVGEGARLLNVCPSYARGGGGVVVDFERLVVDGDVDAVVPKDNESDEARPRADRWVAHVPHLGMVLGPCRSAGIFEVPRIGAAVMRKLADILDPVSESVARSQYEYDLAFMMARRLLAIGREGDLCGDSRASTGRLVDSTAARMAAAARRAMKKARAAANTGRQSASADETSAERRGGR
jgi:hypothetical protein